MDASSSSTSDAPPPTHSVLDTIQTKLSPGVLLIVAILAMVFFIIGLLNLLVQNILRLRRARRRRLRVGDGDVDGSSPTALQGQLQQLFHLHDAGVDQAFIDALPVFVYRAILGAGAGKGKDVDPFDCAVCLCEFGMDDALRLLPTCGHAFHVPCIDAWLLSHSTCPLCRGSVLAAADLSPASSPIALVLESESRADTATDAPGGRDNEGSPKAEQEVVEVKLGKLRCVDGNGDSGELAVEATSRNDIGRRRCLSMGSYEYVTDEHAALRVAIKTPKKPRPRSRRRHALSDCDFKFKKGAWETAVKESAAPADAGVRRDDDTATASRLSKDSFSVSKIWMVPPAKKEDGRKLAGSRRSVSFRWPAMAQVSRNDGGANEEYRDVESQSRSFGSNDGPSRAEERPPSTRTAPLWIASGWQPSSSGGSHS
uniref:Uncharacterized protein n=1 Tax=Avena sativa TaxID=4498 RepID=A0ACD5Y1D8_AVESA